MSMISSEKSGILAFPDWPSPRIASPMAGPYNFKRFMGVSLTA